MRFLLVFCASLSLWATNEVNFFEILMEPSGGQMTFSTQPHKLLDYSLVKDEAYSLRKNNIDLILDSPLRKTAFLIRTVERNRGALLSGSKSLPLLSFEFEFAMRTITGEVLQRRKYIVILSLDAEKGMGLIAVKGSNTSYRFDINALSSPAAYRLFINHLVFPFEKISFTKPAAKEVLVDLYYKWPKILQDQDKVNMFDLFPDLLTYSKDPIKKKLSVHLGTTFIYKKEGQWQQRQSDYLHAASNAIVNYGKILKLAEQGDPYEIIPPLEEYVSRVPGDRKALKRLMDLYLEDHRNSEAYNLITRFQPLFATIRGGIPNQKELAAKAERRRNWLLGEKSDFEKDNDVILKIISPANRDLVTGTTELQFALSGSDSPVLAIDCFLGEQLITRMLEPPYKVPFTVDGSAAQEELRVVAYFENETYQEDVIVIRTIRVDAEESVQLVGVRVSVFRKRLAGREFKKTDFRVKENDVPKEIESFRKDTAPLRVAILLDTSISMVGTKLYHAQYAVKTFLSKLAPEDRATIYTFDDQVIKLSPFSNQYQEMSAQVMTLSMQWGTSLYDAMLIAHDALMGQNGTKVMIVVSDGDDSSSATTDLHVAAVIRNSPAMVYSIVLPGGVFPDSSKGERLLQKMAELSGSISLRVRNTSKLSATFDRLYQDLKSFYYMDYYTKIRAREKRKVEVSLKGVSGKVRSREMN